MAVESDSHKLRLWFPALRYGCPSVNIERPLSHAANYRIGHILDIRFRRRVGGT